MFLYVSCKVFLEYTKIEQVKERPRQQVDCSAYYDVVHSFSKGVKLPWSVYFLFSLFQTHQCCALKSEPTVSYPRQSEHQELVICVNSLLSRSLACLSNGSCLDSVTVLQNKITVFVWGKNMILKLVGILNKG